MTCVLASFPEPANAFDRVEILSDAAAVAALDAILVANLGSSTAPPGSQPGQAATTPAVGSASSANQISSVVASPRIRCAAKLYFRGLEASMLCEYDGATSTVSNFNMVTRNNAWLRSSIASFEIGHDVGWPLRDGPTDDRNGTLFSEHLSPLSGVFMKRETYLSSIPFQSMQLCSLN